MSKIIVLDGKTLNPGDNPWDPIESLGPMTVFDQTTNDLIVERARDATIVLTNKVPISRETIEQLPNLKFIAVLATGFNQVDLDAARERGIPVSNVPVYGTQSVAQHVFAMVLSQIHQPRAHHDAIQAGRWQEEGEFCFTLAPLSELAEKTLGILGHGRIGEAVGRLGSAFGMNVVAYRRSPTGVPDYSPFRWGTWDEVVSQSDYVSLHCPQSPETEGCVDKQFLSKMKASAVLINTARGGLVNEADLADALKEGIIAGACLDVVSQEPIQVDNPLLSAPNCLITPHIAWIPVEARKRLMQTTAENIRAFLDGSPIHVVNGV